MQTDFTLAQLADPELDAVNTILRKCVHCGFCTATCPTYVLLGDELDGPRGRIYMLKNMLEAGKPAPAKVVKHIDRCLSCLSCMTTCPASVNYMHLVDRGRVHIERTFERPLAERMMRGLLAMVLPYPGRFRLALLGAWLIKPFKGLLPRRVTGMLALAPVKVPPPSPMDRPQVFPAAGTRRKRVALLTGCAQRVLKPQINEATVRLLTRHGCEVVVARGAGCCGALTHHMGREVDTHHSVKANIAAWETVAAEDGGLDAVVINASGCGTMVKDYGYMLRNDPDWAERAAWLSGITRDVSEVVDDLDIRGRLPDGAPAVTYHSACSLQHGQQIKQLPVDLLETAGFSVREPTEGHLCCGSAGTYNILQSEIAERLLDRKLGHIRDTDPGLVATGKIGCIMQLENGLAGADAVPVVHTVELLDWATGGPKPAALK
jgi:glycolate oxidase iron-sulfur subunit